MFYILGFIDEVLIVVVKTLKSKSWLPADPDVFIPCASSLVFFDSNGELEVILAYDSVDQRAVWHGSPLCNVITEDAKVMEFIRQI